MIKLFKAVALVLAAVLIFSGCSMITKNEARVQNQVVATVNGAPVSRYQVEKYLEITYYFSYYYSTGSPQTIDLTSADVRTKNKDDIEATVETYAKRFAMLQKAAELSLTLTEDEKTANRSSADKYFTLLKDNIKTSVENAAKADPKINVDTETDTQYQALVKSMGFNADDYDSYLNDQKLISKLDDYTQQFAQVTDDDVKKWYDDTLTQQQKDMDADPTLFAKDINSNLICTYIPEDTVAVKQILITYGDGDLTEVAQQLYSDGDTADEMAILKPQIDEMTPAVQGIAQQLNSGTDIDTLIGQFGQDPGMNAGTQTAKTGYLVGKSTTNYVKEFQDAALKLTKVGEVSPPLFTYFGAHILQAIKIYQKGVVPFDELKDQIKSALLPSKQDEKLKEMEDQWVAAAKITYDKGRMFN